jgi:hypothetical protein
VSRMSDLQIEQAEGFADALNVIFGDCEDDRPFGELVAAAQTFVVMNPTEHRATILDFLHFIQDEAPTAAWEHITTKSRQYEEDRTEAAKAASQVEPIAWGEDDASWSIGIYTNEQLEAMTEAEYQAAKRTAMERKGK